ncbi:MAG: DUF6622 family protein [Roseateles sp.]
MPAALPLWPFAILAGLVTLGLRQSRERLVRPHALAGLALAMLALSLYGVTAAFGAGALPVLAWAAGLGAMVWLGGPWVAPRGLVREGRAVRMPGSWLPMALMLGIFVVKFALGFAAGVRAPVLQATGFVVAVSAALGLFSGAFAVRALAVWRCVQGGAAPTAAGARLPPAQRRSARR